MAMLKLSGFFEIFSGQKWFMYTTIVSHIFSLYEDEQNKKRISQNKGGYRMHERSLYKNGVWTSYSAW